MAKLENNVNINSVSRISAGTVFKGEIYAPNDMRVDGTFSGKIFSEGKIVAGETSVLEGDVACTNVDVWGRVDGNLYVKDTLSLKKGCTMSGGLHVKKIIVELGAVFNGTCKMISDEEFDAATKDMKSLSDTSKKL